MNTLELMRAQVRALYTLDGQGRLLLVADQTEPQDKWEAAPRFFLGRTVRGNVWHVRHDLDSVLRHELDVLCAHSTPDPDVIRAVLGGGEEWRGPAYLLPAQQNTGQAVEITPANASSLAPHFEWTLERARQGNAGPIAAIIQGGQAVAVCSSVRLNAQAAEAGVFTLEGWRGHGYAAMVTALWANLVREKGILPLYSTSWENTASQAVARKLNAEQFGEDWSIQ